MRKKSKRPAKLQLYSLLLLCVSVPLWLVEELEPSDGLERVREMADGRSRRTGRPGEHQYVVAHVHAFEQLPAREESRGRVRDALLRVEIDGGRDAFPVAARGG